MKARKAELEAQIKASQDAAINTPQLESFIERIHGQIDNLDFEGKCLVLDMINITVWIDGENAEITGIIDPKNVSVVTTHS